MATTLNVLILEDEPFDAELMVRELTKSGYDVRWRVAGSEQEYRMHLDPSLDLVLADYSLPRFNALDALRIARQHELDVPFIIVTGTIGEEVAVECMKQGVADYLLKDRMVRLGQAVDRVLAEKRFREEKARVEKALNESEARYRALIEQSADSIVVTDIRGIIQYVNPAFERSTGYSTEEVLGRNARILKSGEHSEPFYREMWNELTRGRAWSGRLTNRRKDGAVFREDVTISPVRDGAGELINFVAIKRDVTREAEIERQLRQVQKLEALGTLAGGVAHDFNNILAAIIGYAEISLMRLPESDEVREGVAQILKAGNRAKDLVKQILAFSRRAGSERCPVRLDLLVLEALKMLRASLPATIRIEERIGKCLGTVMTDATEMHQMIMNLCTNAAQAMREGGGRLSVSLDEAESVPGTAMVMDELGAGPYLRLCVEDTGHGMDRATMDRIFEPYFTTREKGTGTGLGLAVVHGIVKGHGGAIHLDSTPGRGTAFSVYLPCRKDNPDPPVAVPEDTPARGKGRVLVVDDERALVDVGVTMLRHLGYDAVGSYGGVEALNRFCENPDAFDLVLSDTTMPGLTGVQLACEIMKVRPGIPFILCSGYSETVTAESAEMMGIRAFLMKPIQLRDLAEVLSKALGA